MKLFSPRELASELRRSASDEQLQEILETERKCIALLEEAITVCDGCDLVAAGYLEDALEVPRATVEIVTAALSL